MSPDCCCATIVMTFPGHAGISEVRYTLAVIWHTSEELLLVIDRALTLEHQAYPQGTFCP